MVLAVAINELPTNMGTPEHLIDIRLPGIGCRRYDLCLGDTEHRRSVLTCNFGNPRVDRTRRILELV
jgi:hypothetical protein